MGAGKPFFQAKTILAGLFLVLVLLVFWLVNSNPLNDSGSTGFAGAKTREAEASLKPVKVGWIGPLTGNRARLGIENQRGVILAVDKINADGGINKRKVELVSEDDTGTPLGALNAYRKLSLVDKADVVLVTLYQSFAVIAPAAEKDQRVVLTALDSTEDIAKMGEYVFGTGIYSETEGKKLAEFTLKNLEKKRAVLVFSRGNAFIEFVKNTFVKEFEQNGGQIMLTESYESTETDFRSSLLKISEKKPDAVVLLGTDEAGFFVKQAREMGFSFPIVGADFFSSKTFYENSRGAAEGIFFAFWQPEKTIEFENFLSGYEKKFGEKPFEVLYAATGFDAVSVVKTASEKCQPLSNECLKDQLYHVKLNGLIGEISMDPDGITRSVELRMFQIKDKQFVPAG